MNVTQEHMSAVAGAQLDAQMRERDTRVRQAEAFCRGADELAERYDAIVANQVQDFACLTEIREFLMDVRWGYVKVVSS